MSTWTFFFTDLGSDTAKSFAAVDWDKTSLGPISTWSPVLKSTLKTLFISPVPMYMIWGEDHIQFYNEAFIPSLAGRNGHAMGAPAKAFWSDIWESIMRPDIEQVKGRGLPVQHESRPVQMLRNGQMVERYWQHSTMPIFEGDGSIVGVITVAQDITQGRSAEEKLESARKEAEDRRMELFNFFMQSPTALVLFMGPNHVLSLVSPMYQEILGTHRRMIGQPAREAFTERERSDAAIVATLDRVYQTGEPHFAEEVPVSIAQADGSEKHLRIDVGYHPLRNADGRILGVMGNILDVTSRVESRLKAESNENLLRLITDRLPVYVSYMDTSLRYKFVNKAYCEWFDLPAEQIEGLTRAELFRKANVYDVLEHYERKAFQGEAEMFELSLPHRDGRIFDIEVEYLPDFDPKTQKVVGIIGVAHDVTQKKKNLAELAIAKEAAENANETKSAFLANMSHEIRTPLGAILGFSELLKDRELSENEQHRYIDTILRNGKALTRIIDDILDLAKVEAGRLDIEEIDFSLLDLTQEVIELFTAKAKEKGIYLNSSIDPTVPPNILSDPTRIRQILINIIGNAIKFTDTGGVTIRMSAAPENEGSCRIQIVVEDTGRGLTEDQKQRLFKPFTQADNTTTRQFGGTGLGLALSQRLCEALGGSISISDYAFGVGCNFVITFLAVRSAIPSPEKPLVTTTSNAQPRALELDGQVILVVDDSTDNQFLVSRILTRNGALVQTAGDGLEAIEKAKEKSFKAILMDIQMPRMDGYEALRNLRERGFTIPIIALTAHAMTEERIKTKVAGFDDHLTKPIDSKELMASLKRLLNIH